MPDVIGVVCPPQTNKTKGISCRSLWPDFHIISRRCTNDDYLVTQSQKQYVLYTLDANPVNANAITILIFSIHSDNLT